ncbi:MAG: tetratricopeptide repeat protein [Chloroflexota bacterium]|nr:tetratricopeptide repeat protein [Chloroflexota bacterium]
MSGWMSRFTGRGRGGETLLIQIARETVGRRRSVQGALNEVRHPAILDAFAEEDFRALDKTIKERAHSDREFALVLARLTHAAAHAKGFDRQCVDAALRLESLLPSDDPSRERDKLLRDAYGAAQRAVYIEGGRQTLARLAHRAADAGDMERARALFTQQLELGEETNDGVTEVDAALMLGDLLRREGDVTAAQGLYRRAGRSAQRLDHYRGLAEALVRQIELMPANTNPTTLAALQRQALDAAERTADLVLQSRIVLDLATTLVRAGKPEEAAARLEVGLGIAQEIGDLSLENRCLAQLVDVERRLGRLQRVAERERAIVGLEERLGNRPAAASWAVQLGATNLGLGRAEQAVADFGHARDLAVAISDRRLQQRALGGLGVAYTALDHPAEALDHLMQAMDLAQRAGDVAHEAQWLGSIGEALWQFGQPGDAVRAFTRAISLTRRIDDVELQASLLTRLGEIHAAQRQTTRARECYGRALDLNRRLGQTGAQTGLLAALGGLAADTGHTAQAAVLFEQALRLASETGDRAAAARLHGRLGRLAQRRGDLELALHHLSRALELAERLDQPALLSRTLQHLATAQDFAGDPAAVATYRRALHLCKEVADVQGETLMRLNLGTLLGTQSLNGHRDEGVQHLRRAVSLAAGLGAAGEPFRRRAERTLATLGADSPTSPASRPADRSHPARRAAPPASVPDDQVAPVQREASPPPG